MAKRIVTEYFDDVTGEKIEEGCRTIVKIRLNALTGKPVSGEGYAFDISTDTATDLLQAIIDSLQSSSLYNILAHVDGVNAADRLYLAAQAQIGGK